MLDNLVCRSHSVMSVVERSTMLVDDKLSLHRREAKSLSGSDFDELDLMGDTSENSEECTRKTRYRLFPMRSNNTKQARRNSIAESTEVKLSTRRTVRFADADTFYPTYTSSKYDRTATAKVQFRDTREAVTLYCELMLFKITEMRLNPESTESVSLHYGESGSVESRWKQMVVNKIIMSLDLKQ